MNYKTLANKFLDQAEEISNVKSSTARFRALAYSRAANIIKASGTTKVTKAGIEKLNLTDYMKSKALSFFESPIKPSIKANLISELTKLKGIGVERAKTLIAAGLKTPTQLKLKKYKELLTDETRTFMSLNPSQKIPHEHIKILEPYILKAKTKGISLTLTGSYRRKKPFSSDIDVMVVSDIPDALQILLARLNKILKGKVYPYSQGADKMSLVVDMSDLLGGKNMYKIDAFRTLPENEIPMLLYSTGSKEFNITMRGTAKKLGYLLNQKGLFKNGNRIPNLKSESDYFAVLKMPFKEPIYRV